MKKNKYLYALGAIFSLLLLTSISLAAEELTGEQIIQLLSGKTVEGSASASIFFTKFYNADGNYTLTFMDDDREARAGRWFVVDNKYCQTKKNREKCYTVEKDAGVYKMIDKGNGEVHTIFQIKP